MTNTDIFQPLIAIGYSTQKQQDDSILYCPPEGYGPGMCLLVTPTGEVFKDVTGYASRFDYKTGDITTSEGIENTKKAIKSRAEIVEHDNANGGIDPNQFNDFMRSVTE